MKILCVVPWDQECGGVASVVGNLAKNFKVKGHKVVFVFPGSNNLLTESISKWGFVGYQLRLRVPIVKGRLIRGLMAFIIFFPITFIQVVYLIYSNRINFINVHFPLEEFFYFGICRFLFNIKLILSIHGADFFPRGVPLDNYSIGLRMQLMLSDRIVAPSNSFLVDFLSLFPKYKNKSCSIPNGVDLMEIEKNVSPSLFQGTKHLLCIAAHNEKKAVDVLLNALRIMHDKNCCLPLVIVGNGPLFEYNVKLATSLCLQDSVVFLKQCDRNEIIGLLKSCELFILPSRSEPFGIVIIEAMASRKPVVATTVGGIPEIIEDGKSGILVKPDDSYLLSIAIISILCDDVLRSRLAANGFARVCSNFTWEQSGAKYEKLFHTIFNGTDIQEIKC